MVNIQKKRGLAAAAFLIFALIALPFAPSASVLAARPVKSSAPKLRSIVNLNPYKTSNYEGYVDDSLRLNGTNFTSESVVYFDTTPATNISLIKGKLYFNVPAVIENQTYQVSVTNGTETSNFLDFYVKSQVVSTPPPAPILPAPELYSIANQTYPAAGSTGYVGDSLLITGANFTSESRVNFDSTQVTIISLTTSEITIDVPDVTVEQSYLVSVTNGSATSNPLNFYVSQTPLPAPPAPVLSAIDNTDGPNDYEGYVGDHLRITGSDFTSESRVNFDATQVTPTSWTASELLLLVPTVTVDQTYSVSVANGSQVSNAQSFLVKSVPPVPTLNFTADPSSIIAGSQSTLNWTSNDAASCTASGGWSGTKETNGSLAVSPITTTTYNLHCTGSGGSIDRSATITVSQPAPVTPVLTDVINLEGHENSQYQVGDRLRITGSYFDQTDIVVNFTHTSSPFEITPATQTSKTSTEIYVNVPNVPADESYVISVAKEGLPSYNTYFVTVIPAPVSGAPVLSVIDNLDSANDYEGRVGDRLKLIGSNFNQTGIKVNFKGMFGTYATTEAILTSRTDTEIQVTVPNLTAGEFYVIWVTNGTDTSDSLTFFVNP